MGELIKGDGNVLIGLIHGKDGGLDIPKPFEHNIHLFDTHVAGTSHVEGIKELELHLNIGAKLTFYREPDNPHDHEAIVIKNADGVKIGYVPQADNVVFSRLMDAGKLLFGEITSKEMTGKWLKIKIKIFLKE